jgi:hypothetical protein
MADHEKIFETIVQALEDAKVRVDRVGDTLNVARGGGVMEAKANIDPVELIEEVAGLEESERRRAIGNWVRGVAHVLMEPAQSEADEWTFVEAAGQLYMSLENEYFLRGAEATAGEPPWTIPLDEDLHFVFILELDMGLRLVTEEQFEEWSATRDRVVSGGRSLIFHKAYEEEPEPVDEFDGVERWRIGDGYDAARCLVLEDLMFGEVDETTRMTMPSPEEFYFVREGNEQTLQALRQLTDEQYEAADHPLTRKFYRIERGGKPVLADD